MAWKKLGLIFDITKHEIPWLKSHSLLPTPLMMEDRVRIYYTGRNHGGQSQISFIDVNREDPRKILYVHDKPLLEIGKIGTFDDCGTVGTCVIRQNKTIYLYYNGYNVRNTVPWSNSIGLAISNDDGNTFNKTSEGPIMDRNPIDPYFTITPCIIKKNEKWHMWYTSGTGWVVKKENPEPLYVIKYANSHDGINWIRNGEVCIPESSPEEANARATIVKDAESLKMWFCYRGSEDFRDGIDSYKIGYAENVESSFTKWVRDDSKAGISCGPEEYDNLMQAYPAVTDVEGKKYLFYSGNGFGANGFCCALWE